MKKSLFFFLLTANKLLFAQFGQITSVQIIPANPTDADQVKAVVEVILGGSPCYLNNAMGNISGSNIELNNYYCEGMLTMICNRTDTISLGTLAAGSYLLNVNMWTGCGPYSLVDTSMNNSFTVTVFSSTSQTNIASKFRILPNPTVDGEIFVQLPTNQIYSIICYDAAGREVFLTSNLIGSQRLKLPDVKGFYFIKAFDRNGNTAVIKVMHAAP
jgi:hypothetical protein